MTKGQIVLSTLLGVGALGLSVGFAPLIISAQTTDSNVTTFVQRLAEKLGLSQDVVESALTSVRDDVRTERETERRSQINTALSEGKLTQREADVLIAIIDLDLEKPSREDINEFRDLSREERQAKREEFRGEREQEILTGLNANGLNVTLEELQSIKEAAKEAGIVKMEGRFGRRGIM